MTTNAVFDPFILLQQVDAFYQTSWNHLILYTGGAIAIVGVVIPILIQLYQSRVMRLEKNEIKTGVETELSRQITTLLENERKLNEEKMINKLKPLEDKIAKDREAFENQLKVKCKALSCRIEHALGAICFVQTNALIESKNYDGAYASALDAIESFVDADEHPNLRRIMNILVNGCLPNLTKDKLRNVEDVKQKFEVTMKKIQKWDEKGDFDDLIINARQAFKSASERAPQTAVTPAQEH